MSWKGVLSIDLIETAPSGNILVNKSRGGIMGLPISGQEWSKMVKNGQKWPKIEFEAYGGKIGL